MDAAEGDAPQQDPQAQIAALQAELKGSRQQLQQLRDQGEMRGIAALGTA